MSTSTSSRGKQFSKMVEELNGLVEQTFYFEQKLYEWNRKVENNKSRISKLMGRKRRLHVKVDNNLSFNASRDVKPKVEFFVDALRKNLDKDTYNSIVDKTATITNLNQLVEVLKSYNVPPNEFKKFVTVTHEVNTDRLDHLLSIGEIEMKDLQGCYRAEITEEIRVTKTK